MKIKLISKKLIYAVAAVLLGVFACLQGLVVAKAFADENGYTTVMEDLLKDESFNSDNYPDKAGDYSLDVFQIAESDNQELFVYVYQPSDKSKDLVATSINISTLAHENLSEPVEPINYELELLSTYGVFDKYLVKDFTVKSDIIRVYEIVSIYRAFDEKIDEAPSFDSTTNTISEVACEIGDLWRVATIGNQLVYERDEAKVVHVTTQLVGYIQYFDGVSMGLTDAMQNVYNTLSYFVAFDTVEKMDNLYEATVGFESKYITFETQVHPIRQEMVIFNRKVGEPVKETVDLRYDTFVSNEDKGWFDKHYEWKQIERTEAFIANNENALNLTKGNKSDLAKTEWILRFTEREFSLLRDYSLSLKGYGNVTLIEDVTVLRLKFRYQGEVYNLGVVSNKQTGSGDAFANADNKLDNFIEALSEVLSWILFIFLLFVLLWVITLFLPILKPVFSAIGKAVKWVICLPFNLLGKLRKDKK